MARKQKMKVYHGIPKSITDKHTIFYADFDGSVPNTLHRPHGDGSFRHNATGYGIIFPNLDERNTGLRNKMTYTKGDVFTIDLWATLEKAVESDYSARILVIKFNDSSDPLYNVRFERCTTPNTFQIWAGCTLAYGNFDFTKTNLNKPHHFRLILKKGDYVKLYIDGKEPSNISYGNTLPNDIQFISGYETGVSNFSISDFHISNIDRGDYFPNLPQDFIEGKAVIKPRMGQQQKKGDPMYSEATCVKIPSFTGDNKKLYNANTKTKRGVLISNPEVCEVTINSLWNSGSSFKLKGLNGEMISGVIDTDTALARITQNSINSIRTIKVNDVSKLRVGDSFRLTFRDMRWVSENKVIESVNSENSTITWSSSYSSETVSMDMVLIETTVSSSSPTVKTQEGTNVVGTWSGLGTSEATFTLGENSGLTGKDLYVEYTLNMPCGNSDFYGLPCDLVRGFGENDVEMLPSKQLSIVDDFSGKILGSNKECPHRSSMLWETSVKLPVLFNLDNVTTYQYSLFGTHDSTNVLNCSTSTKDKFSQQIFSFNVIEMVERKLGREIPSSNKVQWLKENLDSSATFGHYGYGSCPSGNLLRVSWYNASLGEWTLNGGSHTSNSISYIENGTSVVADRIDSDGFIHILIYTDASDGVTPSNIYTDYVYLRINLKKDPNYTYLYGANPRAREEVCNPILIQKETKTVKRFVPSNECFSTEYTYCEPKRTHGHVEQANILSKLEHGYLTTQGTGGKDWWSNTRFQSCLAYIDPTNIKPYMFTSDSIYDSKLGNTGTNQYYPLSFVKVDTTPYVSSAVAEMPMTLHGFEGNIAYLKPYLLNSCNEIKMGLLVYLYNKGVLQTSYDYNFDIPNKPLIK